MPMHGNRANAHEHDYYPTCRFDDVPCPGGYHTAFVVLLCQCGTVAVFPPSNFLLTGPDFQNDFRLEVISAGHVLEEA